MLMSSAAFTLRIRMMELKDAILLHMQIINNLDQTEHSTIIIL